MGEELLDVEEMNQQLLLSAHDINNTLAEENGDSTRSLAEGFTTVGLGRPLLVEILNVYTGDAPNGFLGGKPDLLVVSGVKGAQTFDAAPRAINRLQEDIRDRQYLQQIAFEKGSSVVYYTDCLEHSSTLCSFELVVDSLQKSTINSVSKMFAFAAGLPIFVPANLYLLAGAVLVKLAGELANSFESRPFLSDTIDLRFLTAGVPNFKAGHYIVYNREHRDEFNNFRIMVQNDGFERQEVRLCHRQSGKEYKGDAPYMVVVIDGKRRPDLEGYAPKLATAALLEQFYGNKNRAGQFINTLESALELYSDFTYRQKAEDILRKIQTLPVGSTEFLLAKLLFEAYVSNIRNDIFKIELQDVLPV
jgi:hypothetical protein